VPLARETDYWEAVASKCVDLEKSVVADNSWKRCHQISRLLKFDFIEHKVLEIGCGNAIVGATLKLVTGGHWQYVATELAPLFRKAAKRFGLDAIEADVRELPSTEGGFTRIIAFDSLEHVRPEHREEGYKKMYEVAADGALLFLHFSYAVSYHDKEFDHPYGVEDLVNLEKAGFTLQTYERYICDHPKEQIPYAFVVMKK
jgi:SAM-dependent methyltransferase